MFGGGGSLKVRELGFSPKGLQLKSPGPAGEMNAGNGNERQPLLSKALKPVELISGHH